MNKILNILQNYSLKKKSCLILNNLVLFFNAPWRTWNARKALAVLVLFVGRRYYLRPIILWPARSAIGTEPPACCLLESAVFATAATAAAGVRAARQGGINYYL